MALRLDDDAAILRHVLIAQRQHAFLVQRRQRRCVHVEAQVHCIGHLVDVLAAGALRANRRELDLPERNLDVAVDFQSCGFFHGGPPGRMISKARERRRAKLSHIRSRCGGRDRSMRANTPALIGSA
jgi:hypothetical protein